MDRVLLGDGCRVYDSGVRNSVIGLRGMVGPGAVVESSILMGGAAGHTIALSKGSIYLARNSNLLYHGRIAMNEGGTFKPFHVDGETY
jgi:ADP-glucose pyrophosphorylase